MSDTSSDETEVAICQESTPNIRPGMFVSGW